MHLSTKVKLYHYFTITSLLLHYYFCIQRTISAKTGFPVSMLSTSVNFRRPVELKAHLKKLFWTLPESVIEISNLS